MHPDLSPHLHTPECNDLIKQLHSCHETNKFGKFIGKCNQIDTLLSACLKGEREENRRKNHEKAKAMRQKVYERQKLQEDQQQ